jgi:putative transposase
MVVKPEEYAWSSYRHHAFGHADPLIASHPLYDALGDTPARREAEWRALCGQPLRPEQAALIKEALRTNSPLREPGVAGPIRSPAA